MKKLKVTFLTVGLLLIAAGTALTCYNLVIDAKADTACRSVTEQLAGQTPSSVPDTGRHPRSPDPSADTEYPDYLLDPMRDMPAVNIDGHNYIGILRFSSRGLELPVQADCTLKNLKETPCRYTGSVYLDNMVICAHNYNSQFGQLTRLSVGDTVTFTDMEGNTFSYSVLELETVRPDQRDYMQTGDWDLTLFTCTWDGRSRVTVRCERVSPKKQK